jgi:hypothetical protein
VKKDKISFSKAKKLMKIWDKGNHNTLSDSIRYHANKHGQGNTLKYLRKAYNFNKKGAHKVTRVDGSMIYKRKSGEYLIEHHAKIVSYSP